MNRFIRLLFTLLGALAVISFSSIPADALGLGKIRVKASANRQFKAEIPLFLSEPEGDISANVGSESDYEMLQVQRPDFADSFEITVEPDAKGATGKKLVVTCKEPIMQPSFNLLVRARAGGGVILENYFLVMDFKKSLSLELPTKNLAQNRPATPLKESKKIEENEPPTKDLNASLMAKATPEESIPSKETTEPKKEVIESQIEEIPEIEAIEEPMLAERLGDEEITETPIKTAEKTIEPQEEAAPIEETTPIIETDAEKTKIFTVRPGDYLYKIARKLGISKENRTKAVLAMFERNRESFINNDLNLLKVGSNLKLDTIGNYLGMNKAEKDKVEDEVEVDDTFPSIEPKPIDLELPVALHIPAEEIISFLEEWKTHWINKDNEAISKDYSNDFSDFNGKNKSEFLAARFNFNKTKEDISITIESVSILRSGHHVSVHFTQWFRSDVYASAGVKRLKIKKTTTGLKIVDEMFIPNRVAGGTHPWVVYIALLKDEETAKENIQSLRSAGFEAFEAASHQGRRNGAYRILVGRTGTEMLARGLARQIKGVGHSFAQPIKLPYAILAGKYEKLKDALFTFEKLVEKGYSPYLLETTKNGTTSFGVFIGAFLSKQNAEKALVEFQSEEFDFKISIP